VCSHGDSNCTEECSLQNLTIIARNSAPRETQNARKSAPGVISQPSQGKCSQRDSECMGECSRRNWTTIARKSAASVLKMHGRVLPACQGAPGNGRKRCYMPSDGQECSQWTQNKWQSAPVVIKLPCWVLQECSSHMSAHGDDIRLFIGKPLRARYGFFLIGTLLVSERICIRLSENYCKNVFKICLRNRSKIFRLYKIIPITQSIWERRFNNAIFTILFTFLKSELKPIRKNY
jgi:hypothetical protein